MYFSIKVGTFFMVSEFQWSFSVHFFSNMDDIRFCKAYVHCPKTICACGKTKPRVVELILLKQTENNTHPPHTHTMPAFLSNSFLPVFPLMFKKARESA